MPLPFAEAGQFGCAARCRDLPAVLKLLPEVVGAEARSAVAAYGMVLIAKLAKRGPYIADTKELLNQMSRAKADLDSAGWHTPDVFGTTTEILRAAQQFADGMTIPCTEWPSVDEVATVALETAKRFANVTEWRVHVRRTNGAVAGTRTLDARDDSYG
jgi:methylthioribose-1-phosphate isomerase